MPGPGEEFGTCLGAWHRAHCHIVRGIGRIQVWFRSNFAKIEEKITVLVDDEVGMFNHRFVRRVVYLRPVIGPQSWGRS
jgi:hypothetical protein